MSSWLPFFVYVGGFLEEIAFFSKTSWKNWDLQPFLKVKSYLEMRTLYPILNLSFWYSCSGLLYRMDRLSEFLKFFAI